MGFSRRLLDRLGFGFRLVRLARIVDQIDSAIDGGGVAFDDRTQDTAIGTRKDLACLSRLAIRFDRGVIELVVDGFRAIDVFGFGSFEEVIEGHATGGLGRDIRIFGYVFSEPILQGRGDLVAVLVPELGVFLHHLDADPVEFAWAIGSILADILGHGVLVFDDAARDASIWEWGVPSEQEVHRAT